MKSCTLRDLPVDERPRERLIKYGVETLSLQELLSLIFGRGIKGESVIDLSRKIIGTFGSLDKLSQTSVEELKTFRGLGLAKACQLKACFEIAKRLINEENLNVNKNIVIKSPRDIFPLLKEKINNFHKEHFIVTSLDSRNKVISIDIISIGTLNSSLIHPRETFEIAIKNHAAGIIICHNHPSGELRPSEDDLIVTNNLIRSGKLLGIEIADHLIISKKKYFSFKEKKII